MSVYTLKKNLGSCDETNCEKLCEEDFTYFCQIFLASTLSSQEPKPPARTTIT